MRTLLTIPLAVLLFSTVASGHEHEKAKQEKVALALAQALQDHPAEHGADPHASAHAETGHAETGHAEVGHGDEHAEAGHGDEHGGGHGHHDISQINWVRWYWSEGYTKEEGAPFIAMLFNFLVLVLLLYFAGRKSVATFLKDRRDKMMENIDEAAKLKKEAQESNKLYSDKLDRMKEEEEQIREELLAAAVKEKERLLADAGARAEKMRAEAARLVEHESAEVEMKLRHETVEKAIGVARGILEKKVGPGEQRKLIDQYLGQLGGQS